MPLRDIARHFSGKWLLLVFVAGRRGDRLSPATALSVDGPRTTKAGRSGRDRRHGIVASLGIGLPPRREDAGDGALGDAAPSCRRTAKLSEPLSRRA